MKILDKLDPNFWAPIVIALCIAAQVPGMMKGLWYSYAGFTFCVCVFVGSVALSLRR